MKRLTTLTSAVALGVLVAGSATAQPRPNCVTNSSATSQAIVLGITLLVGGRALPNCRNLPSWVTPIPVQSNTSGTAPGAPLAAPGTVVEAAPAQRGVVGRLFCPYPYRASDTVFSGGSGYVIKDDVRRANGC